MLFFVLFFGCRFYTRCVCFFPLFEIRKLRKWRETRKKRKIKPIKIYTNTCAWSMWDSMLAEMMRCCSFVRTAHIQRSFFQFHFPNKFFFIIFFFLVVLFVIASWFQFYLLSNKMCIFVGIWKRHKKCLQIGFQVLEFHPNKNSYTLTHIFFPEESTASNRSCFALNYPFSLSCIRLWMRFVLHIRSMCIVHVQQFHSDGFFVLNSGWWTPLLLVMLFFFFLCIEIETSFFD